MARGTRPKQPLDAATADKDDALLKALLQGANRQTAAREANYSEATVYRRLNDATFKRRFHEARQAVQEQTMTALIGSGPKAVLTLMNLMNPVDELGVPIPKHVRLGAARAVVELSVGTLAHVKVDATMTLDLSDAAKETLKERLATYEENALRPPPGVIEAHVSE